MGEQFLVDGMLEGAGKILRMMGFDVYIRKGNEPLHEFITRSGFILTSRKRWDTGLWRKVEGRIKVFEPDTPMEDVVVWVLKEFGIPPQEKFFSRCLVCNTPVIIPNEMPPLKWVNPSTVRYCPACKKYYWEGSHTRRMRKLIERLIERARGES